MPPKKKKAKKAKKGAAPKIVPVTDMRLPSLPNPQTSTLNYTIASSDMTGLSRLLRHYNYGEVLTSCDINGSTAIHIAVKQRDINMLKQLIEYKRISLDVLEKRIIGGFSALHHACAEGYVEIVELLLGSGANPNIKADSAIGEAPLHLCCKNDQTECARLLLQYRGSMDIKDNFGNNGSFWAVSKQHEHMLKDLGLPPSRSANADEFLALLVKSNPAFKLPLVKIKKPKSSKDGKKKGK